MASFSDHSPFFFFFQRNNNTKTFESINIPISMDTSSSNDNSYNKATWLSPMGKVVFLFMPTSSEMW